MLSLSLRQKLLRVLPVGFIWLIGSIVFLLVEWSAAGGQFEASDTAITPGLGILVYAVTAMFLLGLLVGYLEFYHLNHLFEQTTFPRKLAGKFVLYLIIIHLIVLVTFPLAAAMESDTTLLDPAVWEKLGVYLWSLTHLNTALQLAVIISLTLLYVQISDMIGHSTLLHHLSGNYHRPRVEERIYLFLDMRSSTTIAERLGHERYFGLLQAYYADLSDAVVRHGGEIYLYVGDEMIVCWTLRDGLADHNCLRCFYAMRDDLARKKAWYEQQYGAVPQFKAGLHYGEVTTGEIGVVKKHIMFTGDVLNTTARIQSLCNNLGVDLLLSKPLLDRLPRTNEYTFTSVGTPDLRGRSEPLPLFAPERNGVCHPH